MTTDLTFRAADRLLVFAPHPDDETLATGELIQLALGAGAAVRVVFATDGDNNPWPQRWSERRLQIGSAERERWGRRRRAEALRALGVLGVATENARFLGWPDQSLTDQLIAGDVAIAELAAEMEGFAPTHVAMPSLRDSHPDHGALRVMIDLALTRTGLHCRRLGYVVHGRDATSVSRRVPVDAARHQRKQLALMEHRSQIILSRRRLLRWASQPEAFTLDDADGALPQTSSSDRVLHIPLFPLQRLWRQHEVLLVLAGRQRIERARVRVPRLVRASGKVAIAEGLCRGRVSMEIVDGTLRIAVAGALDASTAGYVKVERTWPRLLIFDTDTWRSLGDFPMLRDDAAADASPLPQRASI